MIRFVSTRGGIAPVAFDEAVLQGFAADGGLFVPDSIPVVSAAELERLSTLDFPALASELVSRFVDPAVIDHARLRTLVADGFRAFDARDVVELVTLQGSGGLRVLELFHGPTLSFKDLAMGFLMNVVDDLLEQRGERLNIVLATTGDTGPAAAWAAAGKKRIDCWPLYPLGMISDAQARQMTTLEADNVHPVAVEDCRDGGDDLDLVVADLFGDGDTRRELKLSSVNSINWCRVMMQAVHYFHAYFRTVEAVGDPIVFSVPTGAFGNLFGGYLARAMGLPVARFVCANNVNDGLHTAITTGSFPRRDLVQTPSSAIDIVAPYNFWRLLHCVTGGDSARIRRWMDDFTARREARLDDTTSRSLRDIFASAAIADQTTLDTMRSVHSESGYLLDPHGAVAVAAARAVASELPSGVPVVCLATAHPAKFPDVVARALGGDRGLPAAARHPSIENARHACQHLRLCSLEHLRSGLAQAMRRQIVRRTDG
ncbi:MAG: threonine synthase [Ectothiorhodospiraceae bacterium]|nr:threonine synthase [Ectothiorhodospiraceae bacterium]